jgi:hypothetical protein
MYMVLQQRALTQAVGFRHFENPPFPSILARQCLLHHPLHLRLLIASLWLVVAESYLWLHIVWCLLQGFAWRVLLVGYRAVVLDRYEEGLDCCIISVNNLLQSDPAFCRRNM